MMNKTGLPLIDRQLRTLHHEAPDLRSEDDVKDVVTAVVISIILTTLVPALPPGPEGP